ncbi:hypothetical protein GWK18_03665 [Kocuria sp. JC486]|uniref:hypothetical protein n=1 Tax=Kocuria sp. JC486 TaxID=1970736 RepID=UPI00141DE4FC|nr:hypothetical protein [Kocuria sp. JC486]NHU84700.1 hypothetical protein [Kocuria sp. JC486]
MSTSSSKSSSSEPRPAPVPRNARRSRISAGVSQLNRQATRTGKAAAGTVLAAALMSGVGATPAVAVENAVRPPAASPDQDALWAEPTAPQAQEPSVTARLAGVAEELDLAVTRGEITIDQALGFFAQIQSRAFAA